MSDAGQRPVTGSTRRIAALLFFSGLCALLYQVVWLRELRLVFGASTPASAAVLAVFMGGLGYGSLLLGKRAERALRPLGMYANLEAGIAVSTALTPLLLTAARGIYVAVGGTTALGSLLGTVLRLLLSAIVLLPPTLLMGGTLPAAARAASSAADVARRSTALLYGANALGAVAGAALTTFILLEVFGARMTLWLGCGVNLLVAVSARALTRRLPALALTPSRARPDAEAGAAPGDRARVRFVLIAAGVTGFAFLLLELVWYRMLSPLLGGSTYTFGLILTIALLGIGLGGFVYTAVPRRTPPTLAGFALSCALEALGIAVPFALGDRIAIFTLLVRDFGTLGLGGHVVGWSAVTAIVVLPAAMVAGYQFPLLIALLGSGRDDLGRHVGNAYATNTLGSIAGSLAGGFALMPLLSAPGAWRVSVWLLVALGGSAAVLDLRERTRRGRWAAAGAAALAAAAVAAIQLPVGPTAVWRHSPIGTGRVDFVVHGTTRNKLKAWMVQQRLAVTWEGDGRESAVALSTLNDTAFLVNGKSDGAAVDDAPTQVMSGLLGALLHGGVKRTLVIGLGTGSTAGWLATVPGIERVDVVEIEPAILEVARACSPVNQDVLDNPKVHIILGDAREVLLTTPERYDLIFSEPSNPYRAGIASLFTREFYEAVHERLAPGGSFVQWVQAYEIDVHTVQTVYATLLSVFGSVESWRADIRDLLLVTADEDRRHDAAALRERMQHEPFKSALANTWHATELEGVLAHYVANPELARVVAGHMGELAINTDDRNLLEFGIARALGRDNDFDLEGMLKVSRKIGFHRPPLSGDVAWARVDDAIVELGLLSGHSPHPTELPGADADQRQRYAAFAAWSAQEFSAAVAHWKRLEREPRTLMELLALADSYAVLGAENEALPLVARIEPWWPTDAEALRAKLAYATGDADAAFEHGRRALERYRSDPWAHNRLMSSVVAMLGELADRERARAPAIYELLAEPFAVEALRWQREAVRFDVALLLDDRSACVEALRPFEPHASWDQQFLERRLGCYRGAAHPGQAAAARDLEEYLENDGLRVELDLLPMRESPSRTSRP